MIEVRVARDDEARDVDAALDERVELGQEHRGIDDDAVADDRGHAGVEDARGTSWSANTSPSTTMR